MQQQHIPTQDDFAQMGHNHDVAAHLLRRAKSAARHGETVRQQRLLLQAQYWLDQADALFAEGDAI